MTQENTSLTVSTNPVETKLLWMLEKQNQVNSKVSPDWVEKGRKGEWDFKLAASQEIAEFFNSFGYSWWSKSPKDLDNAITEIVDAWHFIMSQFIIDSNKDTARIVKDFVECYNLKYALSSSTQNDFNVKQTAKRLTASLNSGHVEYYVILDYFISLIHELNLSFDYLYARYLAKSCLNIFRQDNGYKQGTYLKVWSGEEDNYHLVRFIDSLEDLSNLTEEVVLEWLAVTYKKHKDV